MDEGCSPIVGPETVCCKGRPMSVTGAPEDFLGRVGLRLNIWGIRARDSDEAELPSGGCICWNDSNSLRRARSDRRYSCAIAALLEGVFDGW